MKIYPYNGESRSGAKFGVGTLKLQLILKNCSLPFHIKESVRDDNFRMD